MLKDDDAVADAGGHGHPTFADVVVVVIDHDIEAEWLGKEILGNSQGICWNGDDVGRLCSFACCFQL